MKLPKDAVVFNVDDLEGGPGHLPGADPLEPAAGSDPPAVAPAADPLADAPMQ
jgi:hypothetical protein